MKPLLVGEANPYGKDPRAALFPYPRGSAGYRLCCLIMNRREHDYLMRFDRVNLCPQKWSEPTARFSAQRIMAGDHRRIVLLGAKVARAFGLAYEPFSVRVGERLASPESTPLGVDQCSGKIAVILPHPSGLCRIWNEPGAFDRARQALRLAGVLPA